MKRFTLFFGLLIMATMLFAQAPQAFNYQAVVRDANGNLLENQAVGIKISLLQGTSTGQEVYAETHATTTNPFGQVDLQIGTGTATTGQFDTIAWGAGPYYLQLAVDLTGGANYAVMGTTQMLSVPYALYAEEGSGWEKTENGITYLGGKVGIGRASLTGSNTNLQIQVSDPIDGGLRIFNTDTIANDKALFRIDANANLQDAFSVQRDGKVGIGTSAPLTNLQITGTSFESFTGIERGSLAISAPYKADYFTSIDFLYNPNSKPTARIAAKHSGNGSRLIFGTSNSYASGITNVAMVIDNNGRVGIGTSNPSTELEVSGKINISSTTDSYVGLFQNNNVNLTLGSTSSSQPRIILFGSASPTTPGSIYIAAPNHIRLMGNIGINTSNPTYPLTVNGTIRSKKVIVDTGWSDFVFDDDYKLMPLHEVEAFIKTNRHLPEIPSAREVEENGVSLGEISASLLQKIEELTLYVIDLKKENEQQQQLIEEQGKQLKKLEKRRNRR
jgi:hypothetical protein